MFTFLFRLKALMFLKGYLCIKYKQVFIKHKKKLLMI